MATVRGPQSKARAVKVTYKMFTRGYLDIMTILATVCFIMASLFRVSHRVRLECSDIQNATRLRCESENVLDVHAYFFNHLYQAIFFVGVAYFIYHIVEKLKRVSIKTALDFDVSEDFVRRRMRYQVREMGRRLEWHEHYFDSVTSAITFVMFFSIIVRMLMDSRDVIDSNPKEFLTREMIYKINVDSVFDFFKDIILISIINVLLGVLYCFRVILKSLFVYLVMTRAVEDFKKEMEKVYLYDQMKLVRGAEMKKLQEDSERAAEVALELYNLYIKPRAQ